MTSKEKEELIGIFEEFYHDNELYITNAVLNKQMTEHIAKKTRAINLERKEKAKQLIIGYEG